MKQKKENYPLGIHAKRLLLIILPLITLQLVVLIAMIMPLEGAELIMHKEWISTFFDGIFKGLFFMVGGTLVLDVLEKKYPQKEN